VPRIYRVACRRVRDVSVRVLGEKEGGWIKRFEGWMDGKEQSKE
jgi:hypothetical protein